MPRGRGKQEVNDNKKGKEIQTFKIMFEISSFLEQDGKQDLHLDLPFLGCQAGSSILNGIRLWWRYTTYLKS